MKVESALILVDLQNDFCEGGSLAVPDASTVIDCANNLQQKFKLVVASKDWHPVDHISFASNHPDKHIGDVVAVNHNAQALWPVHCVQHTNGAEFHPRLDISHIRRVFLKGTDSDIDSYSAFFDNNHARSTGLSEYLQSAGVSSVYIMGLATDVCVKHSVLDAISSGFTVYVIEDGCRGVDVVPGDIESALHAMRSAGAHIIQSKEIKATS